MNSAWSDGASDLGQRLVRGHVVLAQRLNDVARSGGAPDQPDYPRFGRQQSRSWMTDDSWRSGGASDRSSVPP
jgi:hypothetical protein